MGAGKITLFFQAFLIFIIFSTNCNAQKEFEPAWGINNSPKNNDVRVLSVDSNDVLYAAVWGDGIYRSTDDALNWQRVSSGLTNTFVTCMEIDSAGTVYAGTFGSGIFKSTNQGGAWSQVSTEFLNELNIKAIAIYPNGNLLAGTYGGGVSRLDSSNKWRTLNKELTFMDVNCIVIPGDSIIVAGTNGGGIYRSSDDGASWVNVSTCLRSYTVTDMCLGQNGSIYATTLGGGVVYSLQNGTGWEVYFDKTNHPMNATCVKEVSYNNPIVGTNDKGIIKFDMDYVSSTTPWRTTDRFKFGVNDLVVNSKGYVFSAQPYAGITRSTDGGYEFDTLTVQHFLLSGILNETGIAPLIALDNGIMFCSTFEGGIFKSTDKGHTWNRTGLGGIQIHNFYIAGNGNMYVATENGAFESTDQGQSWTPFGWYSEIYSMAINDEGVIFVADSVVRRSEDGGSTWTALGMRMDGNQYKYLLITPNGYLFCDQYNTPPKKGEAPPMGLARSTDNGDSWELVLDQQEAVTEEVLMKGNRIYAATSHGLYMSDNYGTSWTSDQFGFNYNPLVKNMVIAEDGTIYLYEEFAQHVMRSTNQGAVWDTLWGGFIKGNFEEIAVNDENDVFVSTTVLYRSIANDDLIVPEISYPKNDIGGQPQYPLLDWNPVHNAVLYEMEISKESEFPEDLIHETVIISATDWKLMRPLEYSTKYFWRVRSKRNKSVSAWSEAASFITETAPPELIYPEYDNFGIDTAFTFSWYHVDDTYGYHIQIAEDEYFNDIVEQKENISDSTYDINGLELNRNYYWRARSLSGKGTSAWSESRKFTTKMPAPELIKPLDEAFVPYNIVSFAWYPIDNADIYDIQVARDNIFEDVVYEGPTDNDSTHKLMTLTYGVSYYWRIKGRNDTNYSYWSESRKFTTDLEAAILVSPDNFSLNLELPIEFIWDATKDATSYHFQLANDADFNDIIYEEDGLEDKSLIYEGPLEFGTYHWRVRIFADELPGLWAEPWSFSINPGYVELLSPEKNANNIGDDDRFEWDAPEFAEKYHLQVATDEEFSNIVFERKELTGKAFSISQAELDVATKYYWRMSFLAEEIYGLWSEVYNFKTGLHSPTLIYPSNEAEKIDINCEFSWQTVSQAEFYYLQIARDKNFTNLVNDIDNITETKKSVTLDSGIIYYWHVKAKYSGGEGSWSYTRSLKTAGNPSGIDIIDGPLEYLYVMPNPIYNFAEIKLSVNSYCKVRIDIVDSYGRTVKGLLNSYQPAGNLAVTWHPENLPCGVYFLQVHAGNNLYQEKIIMLE